MNAYITTAIAALAIGFIPVTTHAEVARVEISSRHDVLGGKAFGAAGSYEKLTGKVHFAVSPDNPHNRIIADLDKAPRNGQGKVEFSSDLFILKPKDPARANGVLLFDVVNRGNKALLPVFDHAKGSADPETEADFGDGLLLRQGFTLVAVGWQFDVPKDKAHIGMDVPVATDHGRPITGWVSPWFIPDKRIDSFEYASGFFTHAYPPVDPGNAAYRLTEREGFVASPRLIPRGDWQFGRVENGQLVNDPHWITLKGGFRAGQTYQLDYESQNPPVAGLGFAAIRDLASALKYNSDAVVRGRYVYTFGSSQTGRYQRHLVYQGFTTDEQGRQAIDALFIQTGATGLGSFNERFAQPNELGSFTQTKFPIRYETTTDPVTGKRDGLGARVPAGQEPKMFLVDTGSEYWDRGRVAALRHLSLDGTADLPDPPNVRVYMLAGTQHSSGSWPPGDNGGQLKANPNDYRWAQQALLIALDRWAREGVAPPASKHPTLSDATLVAQTKIQYPNLRGVQWPLHVPGGYRADVPGPFSALPFLVPQVDSDGNDIAGIRLPEQAVPLGTYCDWAFRSESIGAPDTLIAMAGSFIPFAKTRAEREKNGDPRLSIEERYPSRADYLRRVEEVANQLASQHYLLQEHVKRIVEAAGQHWDWMMSSAGSAASSK
ncbi:MAG TPA: alpha/beta hydrolase domain-containing protein [Bryobacteraceae bacterium]|nr:alpha/beta hydrolase domain-containing protein [Bryobacteraceae bacterium]